MKKTLAVAVCVLFLVASFVEAGGRSSSSGGSSRSSSSSSSSRSSGSSGGSSRYSSGGGSSRPSSGGSSSGKYSSGSSSKPSAGSSGGSSSKPSGGLINGGSGKYSSGSGSSSTDKTNPSSKYSSSSSAKPGTSDKSTSGFSSPSAKPESRKPTSGGLSEKGRASEQARSQRIYAETQKATSPPKSSYTTADGKNVNIDTKSKTVETIRSKPSTYYRPEAVQQRTEVHINNYHYQHPYNWYYSQPPVYIGGGYNSAFWWMMMEWDTHRRAEWFYHNRDTIDREAYERGLRDAKVAEAIKKLEAEKRARQPGYVDPEFADDPSIIMDANYVEAAYNPEVVVVPEGHGFFFWFFVIILGLAGGGIVLLMLYWLIFVKKW